MRLPARHLITLTASLAALGVVTGCSAPSDGEPLQSSQGAVTTPAAPSASPSTDSSATPSGDPTTSGAASPSASASAGPSAGEAVVLGRDEDYSVDESGISVTITCNDGGDISIDADSVNLQVTGTCEDIDVDGDGNTVTAENADEFDVDGDSNTLTGTTVRALTIDGDSNGISVRSTSEIDLDGSANTVTYGEGEPRIDDDGDGDNSVTLG